MVNSKLIHTITYTYVINFYGRSLDHSFSIRLSTRLQVNPEPFGSTINSFITPFSTSIEYLYQEKSYVWCLLIETVSWYKNLSAKSAGKYGKIYISEFTQKWLGLTSGFRITYIRHNIYSITNLLKR